jgi:hypothetical protein
MALSPSSVSESLDELHDELRILRAGRALPTDGGLSTARFVPPTRLTGVVGGSTPSYS